MSARRQRDPFLAARLETHEHALCNPAARPTTVRCIGLILFRYCNREEFLRSGNIEAWPSIARLALEGAMTEDTAATAMRQACQLGYFERVMIGSRGRGHTSRYRLIPHVAPPAPAKHPNTGGLVAPFLGVKTPNDQVIYEYGDGLKNPEKAGFENPEKVGRKTPDQQGANPSEPSELNPSRESDAIANGAPLVLEPGAGMLNGAAIRRAS